MDLEQIVVFSRNVVTFGYFGNLPDGLRESGSDVVIEAPELHAAKNDESPVQFFRVQYGDVPFDVAFAFESFESFENRGRREMDPCGERLFAYSTASHPVFHPSGDGTTTRASVPLNRAGSLSSFRPACFQTKTGFDSGAHPLRRSRMES